MVNRSSTADRGLREIFSPLPAVTVILFFTWPLISLPFILYGVYNQKKYAYILLSLFTGLLSIYYPPFGDQYRYWIDYHNVLDNNLDFVLSLPERLSAPAELFAPKALIAPGKLLNSRLSIMTLLEMLFKSMDANIEIMRFVIVSLCCMICLGISYDVCRQAPADENKAYRFLLFLAFFFSFPFFSICEGYRQGCGMCLILWAFHTVFFKRKYVWGTFLILMGIWFHPMYLFSLFIFILTPFLKNNNKRPWFLPCVAVFLLLSGEILFSYVFPYISLPSELESMNTYFAPDGKWKLGRVSDWSLKHKVVDQIKIISFALYILFFYRTSCEVQLEKAGEKKLFCQQKSCIWLYLFSLWFFLFIKFHTISNRLFLSIFLLVSFYLYYMGLYKVRKKMAYACLFLAFSSFFLMNLFFRVAPGLKQGDFGSYIISSFHGMITHTYDDKFIETHIYEDGDFDG